MALYLTIGCCLGAQNSPSTDRFISEILESDRRRSNSSRSTPSSHPRHRQCSSGPPMVRRSSRNVPQIRRQSSLESLAQHTSSASHTVHVCSHGLCPSNSLLRRIPRINSIHRGRNRLSQIPSPNLWFCSLTIPNQTKMGENFWRSSVTRTVRHDRDWNGLVKWI